MIGLESPVTTLVAIPLSAIVVYTHFRMYSRTRSAFRYKHALTNPILRLGATDRAKGPRRTPELVIKLALVLILSLMLSGPYITLTERLERSLVAEVTGNISAAPLVIFALDVSGSMAGVKMSIAKDSIRRALSLIPENYTIAFIAFNHVIVDTSPPGSNEQDLISTLKSLEAAGGTRYEPPLAMALSWAKPYRLLSLPAAVIFITDGMPADPWYRSLLDEYSRENVPIYSVLVGTTRGYNELLFMSGKTGGATFLAENVEELPAKLAEMTSRVVERLENVELEVVEERVVRIPVVLPLSLVALALLLAHGAISWKRNRVFL